MRQIVNKHDDIDDDLRMWGRCSLGMMATRVLNLTHRKIASVEDAKPAPQSHLPLPPAR